MGVVPLSFLVIILLFSPAFAPLPNRIERANLPTLGTFFKHCRDLLQRFERYVDEQDLLHCDPSPTILEQLELYSTDLNSLFNRFQTLQIADPDNETQALEAALIDARKLLQALHQQYTNRPGHDNHQQQHPGPHEVPANLGQQTTNVTVHVPPLTSHVNSRQGHSVDIDEHMLRDLLNTGNSLASIARSGIVGTNCRKTIYNYCRRYGILTPRSRFTTITQANLTEAVRTVNREMPNSGITEVNKLLVSKFNIAVPRARVRSTLREVDPIGTASRYAQVIQRRTYEVPSANSMWHVDNNHALIRWKIWVHGGIDGYSRLIPYLGASTNNNSKTSLRYFLQGLKQFSFPSRVRTDYGKEYNLVEDFVNSHPGGARTKHIRGDSQNNNRIERLWRDVFAKVLDKYYKLFYLMEDNKLLKRHHALHMYCLHLVFIPRINQDLIRWMYVHNHMGIRTLHFQQPTSVWYKSMLEETCSQQAGRALSAPGFNSLNFNLQDHAQQIMADFNIDINQPTVIYPRFPCPITGIDLQELFQQFDLLDESLTSGMDIYVEVLAFLSARIIRNNQNGIRVIDNQDMESEDSDDSADD